MEPTATLAAALRMTRIQGGNTQKGTGKASVKAGRMGPPMIRRRKLDNLSGTEGATHDADWDNKKGTGKASVKAGGE